MGSNDYLHEVFEAFLDFLPIYLITPIIYTQADII